MLVYIKTKEPVKYATHYYETRDGQIIYGVYDEPYFYVLCSDGETWGPLPVYVRRVNVQPLSCQYPRTVIPPVQNTPSDAQNRLI